VLVAGIEPTSTRPQRVIITTILYKRFPGRFFYIYEQIEPSEIIQLLRLRLNLKEQLIKSRLVLFVKTTKKENNPFKPHCITA
jgi:hypothetical protein